MSKLLLNPEFMLYEKNEKVLYSSRQVADEFVKEHKNVLRAIDELARLNFEPSGERTEFKNGMSAERKNALSEELERLLAGQTIEQFFQENFFENKYKDASGKRSREIMMTRKGAMLVVMGFTGKKATVVKIGLLNRFEAMEAFIQSLQTVKFEFPAFTDAIMAAHEEPKHWHFSNEINMIYRIVLGMDAKKFREQHGLKKAEVIKPYLSLEQIQAVETLQRVDIGLIFAIPEYEQRKQTLAQYYERMKLKRIA